MGIMTDCLGLVALKPPLLVFYADSTVSDGNQDRLSRSGGLEATTACVLCWQHSKWWESGQIFWRQQLVALSVCTRQSVMPCSQWSERYTVHLYYSLPIHLKTQSPSIFLLSVFVKGIDRVYDKKPQQYNILCVFSPVYPSRPCCMTSVKGTSCCVRTGPPGGGQKAQSRQC